MRALVIALLVLFTVQSHGQSVDPEIRELMRRSDNMSKAGFDYITVIQLSGKNVATNLALGVHGKRIKKTGKNSWMVWTREELLPYAQFTDGRRYTFRVTRMEIDCTDLRTRSFETLWYNDGELVTSESLEAPSWDSTVPGSNGETLYEGVCRYVEAKTE